VGEKADTGMGQIATVCKDNIIIE